VFGKVGKQFAASITIPVKMEGGKPQSDNSEWPQNLIALLWTKKQLSDS